MSLTHVVRSVLVLSIVSVPLIVGCGKTVSDRGSVSGEVKLDGKPLEQGSILFTPVAGTKGTVAGGEIKNGRYQLRGEKGPSMGKNSVAIRAVRKTGKMVQKPMAPLGEMTEEMVEAVAPQFNSATKLTVEITSGENTANFEVQSKK